MGKSAGPDRIVNEVIKYSSYVTCKSITKLFDLILETCKYQIQCRKSYTIFLLLFKSEDCTYLNNYKKNISITNGVDAFVVFVSQRF